MMRNFVIAAIVLAMGFAIARGEVRKPRPHLSKMPLSAEQMAVYKAFLSTESYLGKREPINLEDRTMPLNLSDELARKDGCLQGIDFENLLAAETTVHLFGTEIAHGNIELANRKRVRSISRQLSKGDGETNILELSEVVFDKTHRFAAIEFSFGCGSLCGRGSLLVLERLGDEWEKTKRPCPGWIS